jgi:hypothetical protein
MANPGGYRLNVTVDFLWVPAGVGGSGLGQLQANIPGMGGTSIPGTFGNAQTLRLIVGEQVPGGNAPTQANFNTAMTAAGTDIATLMTAAILAQIQAWSTGGV